MKNFYGIIISCVFLSACASTFPTPQQSPYNGEDSADGRNVFEQTFNAHGGQHLAQLQNVNVSIDGKWKQLIRRIQPLVSDYTYRVTSQERLLPKEGIYTAHYQGPAGRKSVFRGPDDIKVWYNDDASQKSDVVSSSSLTGDSFHLFLLGPLALDKWRSEFKRLSDAKLLGRLHKRIYLERVPGFGFSERDEVVLWIDPETKLTRMIQITLEGHETTKGAHVEVEYMAYSSLGKYIFPRRFFERVNAPISIDAHAWHLTGLDINRNYSIQDLQQSSLTGAAKAPAARIDGTINN